MDSKYMKKALELAKKGAGYTNPNPLVGAVIVKDNRVIGQGYHMIYGSHHAEINAFLNATEDVNGATMYVTLEPCSHYGNTPPCAKTIIEKGIKKVIIGMMDVNPLVAGRGVQMLKDAGIEVVTGVLEQEAQKLNEIFTKYIATKLPFCTMKTAMTLDGKIATYACDSKWITGEESRKYVHQLRHRNAAIMVGIGTVIADDPALTTRLGEGGSDPIRVIVDSSARIPVKAKVLNLQSNQKTILATTEKADQIKLKSLEEKDVDIIIVPSKKDKVDLVLLMKALGERKIDSVLLEGGSELNYTALDEGIVDKVNIFIAPKIIGGSTAKTPVGGQGKKYISEAINLTDIDYYHFGKDIMIEGYVKKEV